MDPYNERDRNRLSKAVETSWRNLAPFRSLMSNLTESLLGHNYGELQSKKHHTTIANFLNQAVQAYQMSLAANRPRILVSTDQPSLRLFSKKFEVATNNLIKEIKLEDTIRRWILDAFLTVGIVKVHMADSGVVQIADNLAIDPGIPYASNIPLDNFVFDTSATEWNAIKYAGDFYRIEFADLEDETLFDQDVVKKLRPTEKSMWNDGDERLEFLAKVDTSNQDELEPMIDLADIWIPRDGMIYTVPVDPGSKFTILSEPVATMEWNGPEFGPYHLLGFSDAPGQVLSASPASHLDALARLLNNLLRKLSRQAERQKDLYTYRPSGYKSARQVKGASDGDLIEVQNPDDVVRVSFPGADPGNQAFFVGMQQLYDRMAGNLSAIMGLGPQADTASQEQLIHSAASKTEAHMQYKVVSGVESLVRDLGWMLWHDKAKTMEGEIPIEGTSIAIPAKWTPEDREADFFDYNITIDVHSLPYQSPSQKANALMQYVTQVALPLAPVIQQQGGMINIQALNETFAELMNMPRVKEIVQFTGPPQTPVLPPSGSLQEGAGKGEAPAMPATSTRNYVRRSVPTGGTEQGKAHVLQQSLINQAGQNNHNQEAMANSFA